MIWLLANKRIVIMAAALFFAGYAGWYFQGLRCDSRLASIERASVRAMIEQSDKNLKAASEYETTLAGLRNQNRDINQRTRNETRKPDYRCTIPAGGLQLLGEAISSGAASKSK